MNPQESSVDTMSNVSQPSPLTPPANVQKIGKFKGSIMLVKESWKVLMQDKELVWFPVLSVVASFAAFIVYIAIYFFAVTGTGLQSLTQLNLDTLKIIDDSSNTTMRYVFGFAYYLIMFFITNFFLAGIYTIVHGRFNGKDLSVSDGFANANKHVGKIFVWSFISATVGIVLQIISEKSKIIDKIVAWIFGTAWVVLTYFSLPSLVIGERSIGESFKESASVIRKIWGEVIIINIGVGLFFGILTFFVMALAIGVAALVPSTAMFISLVILSVIYLVAVIVISSTLDSIIKLALYEYATTGTVPQGFTPELITGIIKSGK